MKIRIGNTTINFEHVESIEHDADPESVTLYFVSGRIVQFDGTDAAKIWNFYNTLVEMEL